MTTIDELEARLAELESRVGAAPRAVAPIQIGELTDVPAPGSPIASQWAQEVSQRIHHRFATPAARLAAFPAPAVGQASFLTPANELNGPEYFDGAAWRRPWNMPWGTVAYAAATAQVTGIGATEVALVSTPAFAAPGGRRYRITGGGTWSNTVANDAARLSIRRDAGTAGVPASVGPARTIVPVGGLDGASVVGYDTPPVNAAQQYSLGLARVVGTGTFTWLGNAYTNFLLVEDVGPVPGGPTTLEQVAG